MMRDNPTNDDDDGFVRDAQTELNRANRRRLLTAGASGGINPEVTVISEGEPMHVDSEKAANTLMILIAVGGAGVLLFVIFIYYTFCAAAEVDKKLASDMPTSSGPQYGEPGMELAPPRQGSKLNNTYSAAVPMSGGRQEFPDFDAAKFSSE